jgi:hypothetical protein
MMGDDFHFFIEVKAVGIKPSFQVSGTGLAVLQSVLVEEIDLNSY